MLSGRVRDTNRSCVNN